MNVVRRFVVGSVRRGTMRTVWPADFGLRTVIRLRSQLMSPHRNSTISKGQYRLRGGAWTVASEV